VTPVVVTSLQDAAFPETSRPGGPRRSTHELRTALFLDAAVIIQAESARPITLVEVARRVASSPRQLRRAFADVGRTTFRSFLTQVRMGQAAELLSSTDVSVREVGRRVGYRQPGQFTKSFKQTYDQTPSQFRAAHRRSSS
jgi:AraC family transcriptional regulator, regulatory protein of adaptative response / methylphosphotriester-DNA alkyltransferase methyltransferase